MADMLKYAMLSNAAYATAPTIGCESSSARAIIITNSDGQTVGFPGTNNIQCLETDLDFVTNETKSLGKVHSGTDDAIKSIWPGLSKLSPSVIYGHSLGGMLALLYAAYLCNLGKPPKFVYAFEPAKISTDDTINKLFKAHSVQVIITRNGNDIIPDLPELLLESWQHPCNVTNIGHATLPIPNIQDHMMTKVLIGVKDFLKNK